MPTASRVVWMPKQRCSMPPPEERTSALPPQHQERGPRKWTQGHPPSPPLGPLQRHFASLAASTRSAPCRRAWPCPLVYADLAAYPTCLQGHLSLASQGSPTCASHREPLSSARATCPLQQACHLT